MTYARQRLGIQGETMACEELEKLGYAIIERRYRTRFGEIDVIANDRGHGSICGGEDENG